MQTSRWMLTEGEAATMTQAEGQPDTWINDADNDHSFGALKLMIVYQNMLVLC